jgi:hypothetical protein
MPVARSAIIREGIQAGVTRQVSGLERTFRTPLEPLDSIFVIF